MFSKTALLLGLILLAIVAHPAPGSSADCPEAEKIFDRYLQTKDTARQIALLKKLVRACPGHAEAWNNLGVLYENQGKNVKAEKCYRKALKAEPGLKLPHAGLGDLAYKRNLDAQAAEHYRIFLKWLDSRGGAAFCGPGNVRSYQRIYRYKLAQAEKSAKRHARSQEGRISKEELLRSLAPVSRTRAPGGIRPRLSRVDLSSVRFDFGSARLTKTGRMQLDEMAGAMKDGRLAQCCFMVEGHTDTIGSEVNNQKLSLARAVNVKRYLVKMGVDQIRLRTRGMGESNPIVLSGSRAQQAPNRRVAFINLGPKP